MGSAAPPDGFSSRRFLVIDDKAFVRAVVRGMLTRAGAGAVIEAADGAQGRAELAARGFEIDCVICDLSTHPADGLDLLQSLRKGAIAGAPRSLCFVMLTGHGSTGVVKTAIALDVNACLVKPAPYEKLIEAIRHALGRCIVLRSAAAYQGIALAAVADATRVTDMSAATWTMPPAAQFRERITEIRRELLHRSMSGIMNSRRAPITAVEPGQVLAEDLFVDADILLAPAGTVITHDLLHSFRQCGDDDAHLWVGDAMPSPGAAARCPDARDYKDD